MTVINQQNTMKSLAAALDKAHALIDGRTEKDWLNFLGNFSSLINFYNNDNMPNGNWSPFLLKDPVILLASISETDFSKLHSLYLKTCSKLAQLLLHDEKRDIPDSYNQLFDQITSIFMYLKQWIYHMQRSPVEYDLKTYVSNQTKTVFSKYFWAILSLRQNLYVSSAIPGILPVDTSGFQWFPQYDEAIWKQNKDKSPYWEILKLKHPVKTNSSKDFFDALTRAGDKVFNFFDIVICYANTEFEKLQHRKSCYPDTVLLRAFIYLLKIPQQQLNKITKKHLQFYYQNILQQRQRPASPDTAFVCATLAQKTATFCLPAGTLFNAGMDAEKQPVLFASTKKVNLSPATINAAYTLASFPNSGNNESLYLRNIPAPDAIGKDENGRIQSWPTFGGSTVAGATLVKQGIAFASPLLLLREGQRTIIVSIDFTEFLSIGFLEQATYYLSTQEGWLKVPALLLQEINGAAEIMHADIIITVAPDGPAIEAFIKNPDGIKSNWPLLKIEFSIFENLAAPPEIKSLNMEVRVSNIKAVQLYNDSGSLSSKTPFPIFGTAPAVNSSFIMGSDEIFSKPLTSLDMTLHWDQLPSDFAWYYQQYNQYLHLPVSSQAIKKPVAWPRLKHLFRNKKNAKSGDHHVELFEGFPFNNLCFFADFKLLQNHSWTALQMTGPYTAENHLRGTITDVNETISQLADSVRQLLFAVEPLPLGGLRKISYFKYSVDKSDLFTYDPYLQLSPLKLTDDSSSGFLKMTLAAPGHGFGAALYPAVVVYTAYKNAQAIADRKDEKKDTGRRSTNDPFASSYPGNDDNNTSVLKNENPAQDLNICIANLPFTPKVIAFEMGYTASVDCFRDDYPFQCFQYAPFRNYVIYDNPATAKRLGDKDEYPPIDMAGTASGFPMLYQSNPYSGCLFLELENVIPSQTTNFYFELAGGFNSSASCKIDYHYLGTGGWKPLQLLSDSTNNLSCSGIVEVNIPADITDKSPIMPENKYWIMVSLRNAPASQVSDTVLVTTNGFNVQRTGHNFLSSLTAPRIEADTISRTQFTIPQVATVTQYFPSFNGREAESGTDLNLRVSTRLLTKNRAVSNLDYSRLVEQQFPEVYFSKTVFNRHANSTGIYVIRAFESWVEPFAFTPLVNACRQEKIQAFVQERASAFANPKVLNFDLQFVQIIAQVSISQGFESLDVQNRLNHSINIFLSPWISSDLPQLTIDQGVSNAQMIDCMKRTAGVSEVESLQFRTWIQEPVYDKINVASITETALLVSSMNHDIKCIPAE